MDIELGQFKITQGGEPPSRFSMLLWGPAGCGKTTLAASAPGKKLWINFDPDGTDSLTGRDDFMLLDLAAAGKSVVQKFKTDDGLGLGKILSDDTMGIDTVVVDSLTSYAQLAVEEGISLTKGATLERPSPGAYGARNALTLRLIAGLLRLTHKYNKHIIFITHEDAAVTDDDGHVLYITMQLGGKLPDQAALQISEVWFMNDTGKDRRIAVRPVRSRKPMKTRMFDVGVGSVQEFTLKPEHTIEGFWNQWIQANGKIPVPK